MLFLGQLAVAGCASEKAEQPAEAAGADSIIHIPAASLASGEIRVEAMRRQPLADTVVVNGQIQPKPLNLAHISTRVSGTIQSVQAVIGETGAASQQLDVASANLDALDTSLRAFKSQLQDADIEQAVTELVGRQTAYQAAMLATSRVMGLNLADYLR